MKVLSKNLENTRKNNLSISLLAVILLGCILLMPSQAFAIDTNNPKNTKGANTVVLVDESSDPYNLRPIFINSVISYDLDTQHLYIKGSTGEDAHIVNAAAFSFLLNKIDNQICPNKNYPGPVKMITVDNVRVPKCDNPGGSAFFLGNQNLEFIDISGLVMPSDGPVSFTGVFEGCTNLSEVILPTTKGKISDAQRCFNMCSALKSVTWPAKLDVSECKDFTGIFRDCVSLESVDLSNMKASDETVFKQLFYNCKKLTDIKLPSEGKVSSIDNMFTGCTGLQVIT